MYYIPFNYSLCKNHIGNRLYFGGMLFNTQKDKFVRNLEYVISVMMISHFMDTYLQVNTGRFIKPLKSTRKRKENLL